MCNERDRLIAYLYDECDATERDAVRQHLDGCDECRTEVEGLRSVRADLLAWDVPAHESVWRPFAHAPARPSWRQIPVWAMAAAAGIVLMAGAAGGAFAHTFFRESPSVIAGVSETPATASLTAADLTALEQRLTTRFGAVNVRLDEVANRPVPMSLTNQAALSQEVLDLRERNRQLANAIGLFLNNTSQIKESYEFKQVQFENRLKNMDANMQAIVAQLNSSGK
jgi:hypothetical protein